MHVSRLLLPHVSTTTHATCPSAAAAAAIALATTLHKPQHDATRPLVSISALLERTKSHRYASTTSGGAFTPPPGIVLRPRTPQASKGNSSTSTRIKRSTQQFFDDDDDWSNPVEVVETPPPAPMMDPHGDDEEDDDTWQPSAVPMGDAAVLGKPTNVYIKTAEFVKSSRTRAQCPPPKLPEFAVIGRSNVGKSSLINMITGKKNLALVSKTPGMHLLGVLLLLVVRKVYGCTRCMGAGGALGVHSVVHVHTCYWTSFHTQPFR